jgi:hypothetical protein
MNALERRIGQRRGATRAPARAPEWPGRFPPPHNIGLAESDVSLLPAKNGLDNRVHFMFKRSRRSLSADTPQFAEHVLIPLLGRLTRKVRFTGCPSCPCAQERHHPAYLLTRPLQSRHFLMRGFVSASD